MRIDCQISGAQTYWLRVLIAAACSTFFSSSADAFYSVSAFVGGNDTEIDESDSASSNDGPNEVAFAQGASPTGTSGRARAARRTLSAAASTLDYTGTAFEQVEAIAIFDETFGVAGAGISEGDLLRVRFLGTITGSLLGTGSSVAVTNRVGFDTVYFARGNDDDTVLINDTFFVETQIMVGLDGAAFVELAVELNATAQASEFFAPSESNFFNTLGITGAEVFSVDSSGNATFLSDAEVRGSDGSLVPEPTAACLLLLGMTAMGLRRRIG